jgi:NAD-dependent dihydropyrimidine dehydrogenase PreA subunit
MSNGATMMHMDMQACTGCGSCVEACPAGAIGLMAGKVVINPMLCNACQACIVVCPVGAISIVKPPAQAVQTLATVQPARQSQSAAGGLALWTGIALALVEHRILPRLMDAFIAALERREPRSSLPATTALLDIAQGKARWRLAHQHRYRGERR